ncbi:ubiquitin carboxyl-terminal hydrolase 37-like isoform X4 [Brienomyrus brachyistius]|uniref:ubiquitin carboxyl-terminal hydrolase 37-like isoform X4 n=1 Tax=Brienomyrus brachyistius TaxID=42636 RepID=UPI0020B20FE1|nr:ubiquitin carboxyl-terminal hydrolase 37-like isoform X4 [Brienomyrus brachyistius]
MMAHHKTNIFCGFLCCWTKKKQRDIAATQGALDDQVTKKKPQKKRFKLGRKFPWLKRVTSGAKESSDDDGRVSVDCRDSGDNKTLTSSQSPSLVTVDSESLTFGSSSTGSNVEEHQSPLEVTRDIPPNEGPFLPLRRIPKWQILPCMADRGDVGDGEHQRLVCLGLPNLGQTCYMNATLQCLFHLPTFCEDVRRQEEHWDLVPYADLIRHFAELLPARLGSSSKQKKTFLRNLIHSVSDQFAEDEQNDAHEFFSCLISQLNELGKLIQAWETTAAYACPVEGNLSFEMLCQRTCTSCGAQSSRMEEFTNLSLDVLPHSSVEDLLKIYFKDSEVEFRCATCRGSHAVLSWAFITLPRVLVLHMKRFSFTPQFELVKVQDPVLLRREISLLPHFREISQLTGTPQAARLQEAHLMDGQTTQEAEMPAEEQPGDASRMLSGDAEEDAALEEDSDTVCKNLPTVESLPPTAAGPETEQQTPALLRAETVVSETSEEQPVGHQYQLVGILSHLGSSATSGHYVSDNFSVAEKGWLSFSDHVVTRSEEEHVLRMRQSSAYMLFYTQQEDLH